MICSYNEHLEKYKKSFSTESDETLIHIVQYLNSGIPLKKVHPREIWDNDRFCEIYYICQFIEKFPDDSFFDKENINMIEFWIQQRITDIGNYVIKSVKGSDISNNQKFIKYYDDYVAKDISNIFIIS